MVPLNRFLNEVHQKYHHADFLDSDPLEFVHRYADPADQEVVALIASVLAYGNVKQIRNSVTDLLSRMGSVAAGPADFVRRLEHDYFRSDARAKLRGFVHRFNRGPDLFALLLLIHRSWREYGSVGGHFVRGLGEEDRNIAPALNRLIDDWWKWVGPRPPASFGYLLTRPADGSTCKRWNMFLRWMGRKDELDPGLWTASGPWASDWKGRHVRSRQLVMPLDTHTGRISQGLGLTKRKSLNWLAAEEVTDSLRQFDPEDPVRFDFSLCRIGMKEGAKGEVLWQV
ncbi:MAG: TIGR02757 family protein [Bacteriovoracia bacterium]